ncbi:MULTISPECIES: DUF3105 domain-containing protein [unclassified Leptolyngbya]|uniref:DUF3105 domain-containing protein n=1 Tax=unclassified Leptolyngbya TaxID=2650499 RepID=UPI0016842A67|nr:MULTISPECIES: DUF3105 domain-containing protein [unclassified Leptolyngbya]MBD1913993.1 DUF3105 domain-containing protein [Leptolyngbya sp. FACHB-8]MBD2154403.1 DUF3105 domain-containing protein [Leptolyngbya sp. FACHB-16]
MSKTVRTRRNRNTLADKVRDRLWLVVPFGLIVFVTGFAGVNGLKEQPGKIESFVVDSPGTPLPPQPQNTDLPGDEIPLLEASHIPPEERATYNSNPPTSGAHYTVEAIWGIHNQAPADEQLVHNLEHGGIVISYNPAQVGWWTLRRLRGQIRNLSQVNPRLVLTPREDLDAAIALTSWGYLEKLDSYDPDAIEAFYDAHIGRGPECQDGQCPI